MFQTSAPDVMTQMWQVIKVLGPIYAIAFGLMGARMVIDRVTDVFKKKYFSAKPKREGTKSTSRRPRRSSIYVSGTRNPRIRRTKTGVYVYYD